MPAHRRDHVVATLRQRFLSASHLGLLRPGDKLPSARDLATEFGVDRRVVLAAYRWLAREGVIELRQRSGIYFAPAARGAARGADWVVDVLLAGAAHGTPATGLADALHRYTRTLRLRAACVECNHDQIHGLRDELEVDYGFEVTGVEVDVLVGDAVDGGALPAALPPAAALAVERADLLVTTPFHAAEVKLVAERLGKPWVAATLRADVFAEIARLLADGPVYAVVADPRFARKLNLVYQAVTGARHLRALVVGHDDLAAIPAGAPTYVTRLAREALGGEGASEVSSGVRAIPEPRALSEESARELLTFVVRANMAVLDARFVV